MSLPLTEDDAMEQKYGWLIRVIKDFGVPISILVALAIWLGWGVDQRLKALEYEIRLQQEFSKQICVNTSPTWEAKTVCWNLQWQQK